MLKKGNGIQNLGKLTYGVESDHCFDTQRLNWTEKETLENIRNVPYFDPSASCTCGYAEKHD